MKLLPAETALPLDVVPRTHAPPTEEYGKYRDCVRWDFGFTCALCFLHEQDLIEGGAEGTALIWIEHHQLKRGSTAKANDYSNCLLSCRFCNNNRSRIPAISKDGVTKLLDPTEVVWSEYFELKQHAMSTRSPSADAKYTLKTYRLDDKRKAVLRENRSRRFAELRRAREHVKELIPKLMERARQTSDPVEKRELVEAGRGLEQAYKAAVAEIRRYVAIPCDAPESCLCGGTRALPEWLNSQLQEAELA